MSTSPRRITGFMARAKEIVHRRPGLTAQEIYRQASLEAQQARSPISASRNPETSLVATIHRNFQYHQLDRRRGQDGRYRFYPKGHPPAATHHEPNHPPQQNPACTNQPGTCCIKTDLHPELQQKLQSLSTLLNQDPHLVCADLIHIALEQTTQRIMDQ